MDREKEQLFGSIWHSKTRSFGVHAQTEEILPGATERGQWRDNCKQKVICDVWYRRYDYYYEVIIEHIRYGHTYDKTHKNKQTFSCPV